MSIFSQLEHRVLVLDGAMGTMIQKYKLTEADYRGKRFADSKSNLKGCNDLLVLTKPEIIAELHEQYLEVGTDIISSNTFNATTVSLADYDLQHLAYDLNVEAAKLARRCADKFTAKNPQKPRFVAGSIGPTNRSLSLSPKVEDPGFRAITFDEMADAYAEQAKALIIGGVDVLLVETVFDTLNAKAALFAIQNTFEKLEKTLPVMVSVTLEKSGRNLSGQTIPAFVESLSHMPLLSIGLNCSFGAKQIRPHLEELSKISPFYTSVYPNAGMPNQLGEYDETPETMAIHVEAILQNKLVNIIGGCCGTTPEHIAKYAEIIGKYEPRKIPSSVVSTPLNDRWLSEVEATERPTILTGLEPLVISKETNFVNVGEQTNVAGSRKFARLISEKNYEEALTIARTQINNGSQIIDICMDDAMLDAKHEMCTFLNLLASETDIARVPIMIDSSKFEVLEAGLKCVQGKSIVNSISLKEGEDIFLQRAKTVRKLGAAVVVMLFDEQGQAVTYDQKIQIAERAYDLLKNAGFPTEDIVFDLNILSIGTGISDHDNYAVNFIEACRWIKQNLPNAKVSGGVSNLSFAFRGNEALRSAMHSVFLYHAIQAGLDMAIVHAGKIQPYESIPQDLREAVEDLVLNRRPDATDRLLTFAERLKNQQTAGADVLVRANEWRKHPPIERLQYALKNGISDFIEEDMMQVLPNFSNPVEIIEGPLMTAMSDVGEQFGAGKLFLPQIVKSARVMKKAVATLTPYIEAQKGNSKPVGKILLATVKGDVHDIGKNIAGVVLACNGYEIMDLGVMIPCEDIVNAAIEHNVDLIGLSGLITPSLDEMASVAKALQERKLQIPLVVGGASTSELHTAVYLNLLYDGGVYHAKDASHGAQIIRELTSETLKPMFVERTQERYENLKTTYEKTRENKQLLTLEEARKNRRIIDWSEEIIIKPNQLGPQDLQNYSLEKLAPYIDWRYFFHAWGLKGETIENLSNEGQKLYNDAIVLLNQLVENHFYAHAAYGIFECYSEDETVFVVDDLDVGADVHVRAGIEKRVIATLPFQRNLDANSNENLCLSDFIANKKSGKTDYICAFACTTGFGVDELVKKFEAVGDNYSALLVQTLADRLAEAFAEHLHERIRKEFWGFAKDEKLSISDLFSHKYQGIRVAVGYPSYPDHSQKKTLFDLILAEPITGIQLTETFMMKPVSSVCGLIFANPQATYFSV
ncbi:MAG: methionine synthase [Bacteroidales bacterium]|jgi:5-methyltetrahydrofolate--homocysteine methyltransferase|nr:methionine synthase [Bacteroidales bacterium]